MPDTIFDAIKKGDLIQVEQLLNTSDDAINQKTPSVINTASNRDDGGQTLLHEACCFKQPAIVRLLIQKKINLEALDGQQRTPLHTAARFGAHECIKILLEAGAKVDAPDMGGRTPLHKACWHWRDSKSTEECDNYQKTAALLINTGAKNNLSDANTPNGKPYPWQNWPSTTPTDDAIESGQRKLNYQHATDPDYITNIYKSGVNDTDIEAKHAELLQALGIVIEPEPHPRTSPTLSRF